VRIATEAAHRAAEAAQDARTATQPAEVARATRRAQLAAARAQEAAAEATDDLRQISMTSTADPRPGWLLRMKHSLEARSAFSRGKELYEARDLRGARPFLEEAVRLDPEYDEARALLGWLQYFNGEQRAAIVTFKTALRREPTWEGLYNGLGWSRLRLGRPQLARDAFRAALETNPQYADAMAGLGLALHNLEDYSAAVPALDQAVSSLEGPLGRNAPALVELREALARSLYEVGRYGDAAVEFERVAQARPDRARLQTALGWAYLKGGRRGDARVAFQRALTLAPGSTDAVRGLFLALQ
jgi:Flp pilus assembly protein TadD